MKKLKEINQEEADEMEIKSESNMAGEYNAGEIRWHKKTQDHLERVQKHIDKLVNEHRENPKEFGLLENRLYFAVHGVDPRKAICSKHNKKLYKNYYGEFFCVDCEEYDDNLLFDPNDEPPLKITGIRYGVK